MCCAVEIYTLGNFKVYSSGKIITEGVNKNSKYWQLFYYLVSFREKSIGREKLIGVLNLDQNSDPESALSALVYRLRQKLTDKSSQNSGYLIKTVGNAYTLNSNRDYWLDVELFAQLCNRIQNGCNSQQALNSFRQILELYEGEYLEDVKLKEWVWHKRNYYRDLLVTTLLQLDSLLSRTEEYELLTGFYNRVQQLVAFDERLMAGVIESLLKIGHQGVALRKYRETVDWFEKNGLTLPARLQNLEQKIIFGLKEDPTPYLKKLFCREHKPGALICGRDLFTTLCHLEKRRASRDLYGRYVLHIKLVGGTDVKQGTIKEVVDKFFDLISDQIRAGDVLCHWSERHFLVLLFDLTKEETGQVWTRLKNYFVAFYELPENLRVESEIFQI